MRAKLLPPAPRLLSLLTGAGIIVAAVGDTIAQEFINLNFEQGTNRNIWLFPCTRYYLDWNVAAPGWSHSSGHGDESIVYYGLPHIGATPYFLLMDESSPCNAPNTHLAGRYSLQLASGTTGSRWLYAHIAQTGLIPAGTRYLHLLAAGPLKVYVDGVEIPMQSLGDNAYQGDIAPFAGTTAELKIQNAWTFLHFHRPVVIDNIQFLSNELPPVNAVAYTGGVYRQDFDTLESGLTNTAYHQLPAGWFISSTSYDWVPLTGELQNALGVHCFSATAEDPDKSIGLRAGDSSYIGVRLRNDSGTTLRSLTISFDVKQWATWYEAEDLMTFAIGTNNSAGTWSFTEIPALKVKSVRWYSFEPEPDIPLDPFVRLDGNAPENRRRTTATILGIAWELGWSVWLRWTGNGSSYGQAVAIDNFALQTQPLLQIASVDPGRLRLRWPADESGFSVEASAHLGTSAVWTRLPDAPVSVDGAWTVEVNADAAPQFFRLTKP